MTTNRRTAQVADADPIGVADAPGSDVTDADRIDGGIAFLPFLTPVRGHGFAATPPGDPAPVEPGHAAVLQREQDNPADTLAVAVWLTGSGTPWRIGYLERAVAARIAPRLDRGLHVDARLAGWWEEPNGRWRRPVVALEPDRIPQRTDAVIEEQPHSQSRDVGVDRKPLPALDAERPQRSVWSRPPGSRVRRVS